MSEILFILTTIFIFYAIHMALRDNDSKKKSSEYQREPINRERNQEQRAKRKQQEQAKREQQNEPDKRDDEEILGLSREWTQEDLKAAYRLKCNRLHPDKWEKMPKQMQTMMENEFKAVQQSYKNLLK